MTSKTIFNMNTKLKKAAMKKARTEGWTLSAVLNLATRAYIEDRLRMEILDPELAQGLDDIKHGRVIPWEEIKRELAEERERSRANSPEKHEVTLLDSGKKNAPHPTLRFKK